MKNFLNVSRKGLFSVLFVFFYSLLAGANILDVIVQNPLIGRASGKFTNAIFYKNYSNNVVRSKPVQVMDAKSATQLNQRSWFKDIQAVVGQNLYFFKVSFAFAGNDMSAYAYAIKKLFTAGSEIDNLVTRGVAPSFVVSSGDAVAPVIGTVVHVSATSVTAVLTCPVDEDGDHVDGDWYYLVIQRGSGIEKTMYNGKTAIVHTSNTQTVTITLPAGWTTGTADMFFYYVAPLLGINNDNISESTYKQIPVV
jgi:hypothetical protein